MIAKLAKKALHRLAATLATPLYAYAKTPDPPFLRQRNKPKPHLPITQQVQAKKIEPTPAQQSQLSLQSWREKLNAADSFEKLKALLDLALSHKSTHLALYLQQLNAYLTPSTFQMHRAFFTDADARVNTFSANLSLTAHEFIEILRFRGTIRGLAGQMSFLHNFGFQKKASILAATFMHNREFSLSQAVLALRLVIPLGGVSLLLLMNFIKFFKEVANGDQAGTIKVQHLLSILGLKFLKRNEMIIQNTLYDHVLHHLLQNMSTLMKGQNLTIKIDTLCTLLCFDSRNNYRTDPDAKRHWTIALLDQTQQRMDEGWVKELWGEFVDQPGLQAVEVAYILECICFAKKNLLDFQCLDNSFTAFEGKALQIFEKELEDYYLKQLTSQVSLQKLIRFAFNPFICHQWISRKAIRQQVFTVVLRANITRDQTIEPLVNLINSNPADYESKLRLLELAKAILTKQIQQGVVLQALTLTFIQRASPDIALALIDSVLQDSHDPQRQLFLTFTRNCCGEQTSKNIYPIQKTSRLIRDIYTLAMTSQSERGYQAALAMIEDNFTAITQALLSEDSNKANRSQMNAMLSQESFYVSWIIYANLTNGKQPSPAATAFFQRLLKNDIIKFELLTRSYQEPYPRPTRFPRPVLTSPRVYDSLKFLGEFFDEDKYTYFVWDILLKRLSCQPASVREECFPLVEATFLRAYRKEKARKVVMATVLSSQIAGGVIAGTRLKLQGLLETAVDELVTSEELIEYHYSCYLLLVSNALAADILSPIYFDKIMLHSLNKDPKMRHTCSLMLLYGASLRSRNEVGGVVQPKVVQDQTNYLKFLINRGHIALPRFARPAPTRHNPAEKREVELTGRLLAIFFSFGVTEVVAIENLVAAVLEGPMEFGEWRCVANCYTPENYSLEVKREAAFRGRVNQLLIGKVILFNKMGLLSKAEETYFIDKFK